MSFSSLDGFVNQLNCVGTGLFREFFKRMFGKGCALGFFQFGVGSFYNFIKVRLRPCWYVAHCLFTE